jgi:RimJ/RimL family protein N-acetyltransferase
MLRPEYPIETERLLLRPYREADIDVLHDIQSRPEVVRYLYWEPRTRERVEQVIRESGDRIEAEGNALELAIQPRDSDTMVGDVVLMYRSAAHRQGEIGFVLHPDHHGHGYAGEAVRVLIGLGFEALGLHRIVGRCDPRNAASARLMEGLGMRREAHLRENEYVKGEWVGEYVYALLADEWRARQGTGA